MKTSTNIATGGTGTVVKDTLLTDYNVTAKPRLILDWNYNRYATPTADNNPAELDYAFDPEAFPITSIYQPNRPTKGISKARVGMSTVSETYSLAKDARYYLGSIDDVYKYWTSPYPTDNNRLFPTHGNGDTMVQPYILYPRIVKSNKIVIKVDNQWATPDNYIVAIKKTANQASENWAQVAGTSPTIKADGTITLYFNGTAWVTTKPSTLVETDVSGIQFKVFSMKGGIDRKGQPTKFKGPFYTNGGTYTTTGQSSFLNLIEIGAHLEKDLSDRLISVTDTFEMSEVDQIYPIGTITSNQGSFTLDNTDGLFNYENTSSLYYRLTDANVEVNLEYIYTVGGNQYSVQQFKMYTENWNVGDGDVTVEVQDYSKFLKVTKPNKMMFEDNTVTKIVWRLLDSVGFVDYEIQNEDLITNHHIPVFWTTGEESIWDILNELAVASQTAIYFDAYGKLQVRVREAAFNKSRPADWTLRGQKVGVNLPDILTVEQEQEFEANSIDISYKTTKWRVGSYGEPAMSTVWQPEDDTLVVRSAPLVTSMNSNLNNSILISQQAVGSWPWESIVQIDGELMRYRGKLYVFFTGESGQTQNTVWVGNQSEFENCYNQTPAAYKYKNYFTGHLLITERGIWNTVVTDHPVDVSGWRTRMEIDRGARVVDDMPGFYHNQAESIVGFTTPRQMNNNKDTIMAMRGTDSSSGYDMQGCRIRFNNIPSNSGIIQRAGMMFRMNGSNDNGYYVEVRPTNKVDNRTNHNEVTLYVRQGRDYTAVSAGMPIAIAENVWYDIDVAISGGNLRDTLTVYLNGQIIIQYQTTAAQKQPNTGRIAMAARGNTDVSYEYIYGVTNAAIPPGDMSFFDLKYGGVRSGGWAFEQVWQTSVRYQRIRRLGWGRAPYKKMQYLFDEFGPYVHEVREFDVSFDPGPVQYSTLFSTNTWYAATVEYIGTPFGAKFVIANAGRNNAILHGEDNLVYAGGQATVNQACVVLGRDLEISEGESIKKTNDQAVYARGLIEGTLESDWIQSKGMAEDIGEWIVNHWGSGVDQIRVTIFGNPLIEVGDLVAVDYDEKNMDPTTHKYFVVGVDNDFDAGIETTLTLRRVV